MCLKCEQLRQFFTSTSGWAILISVAALIVSMGASNIALKTHEAYIKAEKLAVRPDIRFEVVFNEPTYFKILNLGSVDAIQVVVQFLSHRYQADGRLFQIFGTEERMEVEELVPLEFKKLEIPQFFIDTNSRLEKPLENNVIEARISYRRDSDRQLYIERAFYFINPNGNWVGENDSSLTNKKWVFA